MSVAQLSNLSIYDPALLTGLRDHLRRDPRVAITVVDPQNPYRWISITGRAELTHEDADAQIDRLAKKYIDKDVYPWHKPEEQRVKVRISPERIDATGFND